MQQLDVVEHDTRLTNLAKKRAHELLSSKPADVPARFAQLVARANRSAEIAEKNNAIAAEASRIAAHHHGSAGGLFELLVDQLREELRATVEKVPDSETATEKPAEA
jgi:hypothetical protein